MSDLRELRDTVERVFKQVCRLSAENKNLARLQCDLGDIFGRLARAAAEQEALSRAPQDIERAKRRIADMQEETWYNRKGSNVEYCRNQVVKVAIASWNTHKFPVPLQNAIGDYLSALSASPDPEGEWQWVPKGWVITPEEPDNRMYDKGHEITKDYHIAFLTYRNMLAARPPVPKKGERV